MSAHSLVEIAPSGVSAWSGPTVEFRGSFADHFRVHVRIPLCSIGTAPSTATVYTGMYPAIQLTGIDAGGTPAIRPIITTCVAPATFPSASYISVTDSSRYVGVADCPILAILSQAFTKYRVASDLELAYSPQTTTIDPTNFALAVSDDPYHPVLGMGAFSTSNSLPTMSTIKSSPNSVVFASWSTWSRKYKVDTSQAYYTDAALQQSLGSGARTTTPLFASSDLRLTHFASITASANSLSADATYQSKGQLFVAMDIEFFDLVPITATTAVPYTLRAYVDLFARPELEAPDSKEEAIFGDPPPDAPAPRLKATLGSSGYYCTSRKVARQAGDRRSARFASGSSTFNRVLPSGTRSRPRSGPTRLRSVPPPPPASLSSPAAPSLTRLAGGRSIPKLHTRAPVSLHAAVTHLVSNRQRILLAAGKSAGKAQRHLQSLQSNVKRKPSGWKGVAKKTVKSLVSEIPAVGPILGEITEAVGGPILDWIESLF